MKETKKTKLYFLNEKVKTKKTQKRFNKKHLKSNKR